MKRMDTIDVVARVFVVLAALLLALMLLAECQHSTINEQKRLIAEQVRMLEEKDSILYELCFQRDSLQLIIGIDND